MVTFSKSRRVCVWARGPSSRSRRGHVCAVGLVWGHAPGGCRVPPGSAEAGSSSQSPQGPSARVSPWGAASSPAMQLAMGTSPWQGSLRRRAHVTHTVPPQKGEFHPVFASPPAGEGLQVAAAVLLGWQRRSRHPKCHPKACLGFRGATSQPVHVRGRVCVRVHACAPAAGHCCSQRAATSPRGPRRWRCPAASTSAPLAALTPLSGQQGHLSPQ